MTTVKATILPTLGPERRATYSPFLPISPRTGIVLQVPTVARDPAAGTITYVDPETGEEATTLVTGGRVKCQWKADWALRWVALGVDYEMSGKDLIDSVTLASKICRVLGANPPDGFNYELFLDDKGQKISKSKGNGLTIDEWLAYASPESLSLFMFQKPRAAKRLYFDVIPRAVDDYYQFLAAYPRQDVPSRLSNPVWHIHSGAPPDEHLPVPFSMLLNLGERLEHGGCRHPLGLHLAPSARASRRETSPALDRLVHYAVRYYHDFVKPKKRFRAPDAVEREALAALDARFGGAAGGRRRRIDPDGGLRCRPQLRALPDQGQARPGRPPRRRAQLVRHALRAAASGRSADPASAPSWRSTACRKRAR